MKKILDSIISFFLWTFGLITFFLGSILILITGLFTSGNFLYLMIRLTCKSVLFMLGIRVIAKNLHNYKTGIPYIIMMNHVNTLDPFVIFTHYHDKAIGIEEEKHFSWPIYGWLLKRIGQIPINRKSSKKAMESLKKALDLIKERAISIMILPEGSRTRTGKLGPFKKGGFLLAIESGLSILPIIQRGSYQIKKYGNWMIKPGKIDYILEKPISTRGYTRANIHKLINKTREVFLKYLD